MSKHSAKTKGKRRSKTLPALGFAGVSLSMASGACAPTGEAMANTRRPHRVRVKKSFSPRKKSPTSAWQRFMSLTMKLDHLPNG